VKPLSPEQFRTAAGVSRETLARLQAHAEMLIRWNRRINLVAASTLADPWRRHFLDSMQLLPLIPGKARVLVDLGSGAGFPGLVLAAATDLAVHLVERDQRKAVFLREVMRVSGIKAEVHVADAAVVGLPSADVITARAFAPLAEILGIAHRIIRRDGITLLPKGRNVREELTFARKTWKMHVESIPSQTDSFGVILAIGGLHPVERSKTEWTSGS